jgi:hypothetical protein
VCALQWNPPEEDAVTDPGRAIGSADARRLVQSRRVSSNETIEARPLNGCQAVASIFLVADSDVVNVRPVDSGSLLLLQRPE